MNKPNTRLLAGVSDPANEAVDRIAATGGTLKIVRIATAAHGAIWHFLLNDVSEAAAGYTARLYCSARALNEDGTALATNAETFRVIPPQTVAAASRVADLYGRYAFANADGEAVSRSRELILVIDPAGTGDKFFELQLVVEGGSTQ